MWSRCKYCYTVPISISMYNAYLVRPISMQSVSHCPASKLAKGMQVIKYFLDYWTEKACRAYSHDLRY